MITQGKLKPKEGILKSPFFNLPKEEQLAIVDGLAKGEPLQAPEVKTGWIEKAAIAAGLKDEIKR